MNNNFKTTESEHSGQAKNWNANKSSNYSLIWQYIQNGKFGPIIIKIGWAVQKLWPFWWAKSGRFSVFLKNVKKMTFLDQNIFFSLPNRLSCFLL